MTESVKVMHAPCTARNIDLNPTSLSTRRLSSVCTAPPKPYDGLRPLSYSIRFDLTTSAFLCEWWRIRPRGGRGCPGLPTPEAFQQGDTILDITGACDVGSASFDPAHLNSGLESFARRTEPFSDQGSKGALCDLGSV
jgi:hypothetical protein